MNGTQTPLVESQSLDEFASVMRIRGDDRGHAGKEARRLNLDQKSVKDGLGQLVLTLIKLLHELLERQAIRRMESGSLTDSEIERLGMTLMLQAQEIERLRKEFGLEDKDLNLDLGPLGKLM
jgi:hypothetical protein